MTARLAPDVVDGLKLGLLLGAAVLVLLVPPAVQHEGVTADAPIPVTARPQLADFAGKRVAIDVRRVANWVVASRDNHGLPFVIIDKLGTQVYVFEPGGALRGTTPVLIGAAIGDDSVDGIGLRPIDDVRPEERTTPAGRFVAEPGRNATGEEVIWVDYDAAVSMHRVRAHEPAERRLERLATPTPLDNRISYGCINVPVAFFEQVLQPMLGKSYSVVYVLPETRALDHVFPEAARGYDAADRAARALSVMV